MPEVKLAAGRSFECAQGVTILEAAIQGKITIPYSCKTGRCSTCKCKVISGETKALVAELGLTESEKGQGWILSCARTTTSDVVLEAEDLGGVVIPPAKTQTCRISILEKLAPDVIKVVLRLPPAVMFNFIPGQYIDVIGPGGVRRSYSLANAPKTDNTLELHIRAVENGVMSHYWFNQAAVNDLLRLHGPQGTFFMRNLAQRELILLATGTGIAPVKAMLEALPGKHRYIPVLSRAKVWQGERGYIQDVLLRYKSDLSNFSVYACGSDAMIHSAKEVLTLAGLPSHHFYSDAFVCSGTGTYAP
jgi:CDP-4-dehydro-6-deoxyglucose reductase